MAFGVQSNGITVPSGKGFLLDNFHVIPSFFDLVYEVHLR